MNFRTLIMLAVAALVIIIAVKMNRNPAVEEAPATAPAEETVTGDSVMTEEETQELIYDDMDGTVEVPAQEGAAEEAAEDAENAAAEAVAVEAATEAANEATTDVTVGEETVTTEEAQELAPATVTESPADALQTGPAEVVSDEAVTPSDEAPAQQ